jgi:ABC-type siderophore export system fused ATPase/permease subunit
MALPYDLTNASNMTGITDLFTTANQLSNNLFGVVILLVWWFLVFMQLKNYSTKPALLVASFTTTIVAVFLFLFGMVSQVVLIISIVLTAGSFAFNFGGD